MTQVGPDQPTPERSQEEFLLVDCAEDLARLVVNGWIVDGRSGGLVRGRLHSEGHILMISPMSRLGAYSFAGLMEGNEYLMSVEATAVHMERLREINADKTPATGELPSVVAGRVIEMHAEPHDKLLLIHQQFIINRNSTIRHLDELIALNSPYAFYRGRIFTDEELDQMRD